MTKTLIFRLLLGIAVAGTFGLGSRAAWAQGQESSSRPDVNDSASAPDDATSPDSANAEPPAAVNATKQYAVALNSDRLIQLGTGPRFRFLYWSDFTEAYDNRLNGGPSAGSVSVWVPTVGFMGHNERSEYLFQYSATVSEVNNPVSNLAAYHNGAFTARGDLTRDWGWDISLGSRYGVDQLRLLSGLSYGVFGGVPVANSGAAAIVLGTQPILNTDESLGLHWQITERNRLSLSGYHSYYSLLSAAPSHTNSSGFSADFGRSLSRRVTFHAYGADGYSFGVVPCTFVDAGLGLDVTASARLSFQVRGGPSFGSLRCTTRRGENYNGSAVYRLTATSSVYLAAARVLNSPVLLPRPQTQDSFSSGYARQVARNVQLRLDSGYVRIEDGVIVNSGSGHGYFVSPQAQWQFARSFSLLGSYRHVYQRYGLTGLGRNQVLITLEWRPQPRGLYQ
jgi:hypothetical protein